MGGIFVQKLRKKVLETVRVRNPCLVWKRQLTVNDVPVEQLASLLGLKWCHAEDQLVCNDADSPPVTCPTEPPLLLYDLGGQVGRILQILQRCISLSHALLLRHREVYELQVPLPIDHQIAQLQVPVHDSRPVQVADDKDELCQKKPGQALR